MSSWDRVLPRNITLSINPFPFNKVEELIRVKFALINNVCQLKYKSHRFNDRESKLLFYARCKYFQYGCYRRKFEKKKKI